MNKPVVIPSASPVKSVSHVAPIKHEPIVIPTPPGVAPVPGPPVPVIPPLTPPKDKDALLEGDQLLQTLTYKNHVMRVIKRTDPSQFIPFFCTCSCGYQARLYDEGLARVAGQGHIDWVTVHPTRL